MRKPKRSKKLLDQRLVTEFAEFRALKNKIEKWTKLVSADFLAKFKLGFVCPTSGPFLLEVEPGSTANIDWKEEFFLKLKADIESTGSSCEVAEKLAIETMAEMDRLAGRTPYQKIAVKTNPAYNGKLMAAIVKKLDARSARGF
jgi:hypothetical protein